MNARPTATIPALWRVHRRRRETRDTVSLEICPPPGQDMAPYTAGRFNMLYGFGAGEVPISISGVLRRPDRLMHTVRAVGGVTRALSGLAAGQPIGVRGPFGSGWPLASARRRDVVLVAGGLGMAPLRPAVCQLLSTRRDVGRVILLYGARTPEELLFRKDLSDWDAKGLEVSVTVDAAGASWPGQVGLVTRLISRLRLRAGQTLAMICGPEVMMRFAVSELIEKGVDAENIFLSLERNMKCGIGLCGHCQYGPFFLCKEGPVLCLDRIESHFYLREL